MSRTLTLRSRFNTADIVGQLDPTMRAAIENRLTYQHVQYLKGADAIDAETNVYTPIQVHPVRLYSDRDGRLTFPAGFAPSVVDLLGGFDCKVQFEDLNPPRPRPNAFDFHPERIFRHIPQLRPRQDEAIAAIAGNPRGIIDAPTAFGKGTIFCAVAAAFPNARIDVVVGRTSVAKTLRRRLLQIESHIGLYGAGSKERGRRITVYVSDSLQHAPHDHDEADFLLFDEVHESPTATTLEELAKYRMTRMYGATASHNMRGDGADHRLEGFFGKTIFHMTYPEAQQLGLVVPIDVEFLRVQRCPTNLDSIRNDVERERRAIWTNDYRNEMIAAEARKHLEAGDQVLILVRTVEHVVNLHAFLPDFAMCYDKMHDSDRSTYTKRGLLNGNEPKMTPKRRDAMREDFESGKLRAVIANDVWSTGVDFPQLGVMIRGDARCTKTMDVQAPGRLARTHDASGKARGLLIDCLDEFDDGFLSKSHKRRRSYQSFGWEVKVVDNGKSRLYG